MSRINNCGIYKITCLKNNKIYIGSSKNLSNRLYNHKYSLKNGIHKNVFLQKDWNYYGEENFKFEIIEYCDEDKQYELEQKYLNELKPFYRLGNGYNILENVADIKGHYHIRFCDIDEYGDPHSIKGIGTTLKMPITYEDYTCKTKDELQAEYDTYEYFITMHDDLIACNPEFDDILEGWF